MTDVLEAIRRYALESPSLIAVESDAGEWTYGELLAAIEDVAAQFAAADVHTIGLAADNGPDWIIADLAARLACASIVPLPPFFSAEQLEHAISDAQVDALIVDSSGESRLGRLAAGERSQVTGALSLLRSRPATGAPARMPPVKISYTSGTTGAPKGVCLSWEAQNAVAASLVAATRDLGITRHLSLLPMSVLLENVAGVYAPLSSGATIVCPSAPAARMPLAGVVDAAALLEVVSKTRAQSVILLPQLLAALVTALRGRSAPAHLQLAAVGGARTPVSVLREAFACGIPAYEGYGLTECSSVVSMNLPFANRTGSVGRPLPHAGVRILPDGEIVVSGAVYDRYTFGGAPHDAAVATGDIGYFDSDGYLYIQGRKKNIFVTSYGRNISPEWVESAMCSTDSIDQAVVFGEGRPWNVAIVCARPGRADRDAIDNGIRKANQALPAYARISQWVLADEQFSTRNGMLTVNGRYRRDVIFAHYKERIAACYEDWC